MGFDFSDCLELMPNISKFFCTTSKTILNLSLLFCLVLKRSHYSSYACKYAVFEIIRFRAIFGVEIPINISQDEYEIRFVRQKRNDICYRPINFTQFNVNYMICGLLKKKLGDICNFVKPENLKVRMKSYCIKGCSNHVTEIVFQLPRYHDKSVLKRSDAVRI